MDVYFLAQHYGLRTRLLDWTLNPLAALYFATQDDCDDGEIFLLDAYAFTDENGKKLEGIATARRAEFKKNVDVIASWKKHDAFGTDVIPVRPDHSYQRISAQSSCFTFHTPSCRSLTRKLNPTLKYFTVPRGHKAKIRETLLLAGVNQFTVLGDLDSLANMLNDAHERG